MNSDPHNNSWSALKPSRETIARWSAEDEVEQVDFFKRHGIPEEDRQYYNSVHINDRQCDERWGEIDQKFHAGLKKDIAPKMAAAGPYGIMDKLGEGIEGLKCMADGKMYDSKSKYYAALKATDSHIVEKGEHKPETQAKLRGDYGCRNDLKRAIQKHLH